jgi:hypothetical protein
MKIMIGESFLLSLLPGHLVPFLHRLPRVPVSSMCFQILDLSLLGGGGIKRDVWVLDESKLPCLGKVGKNNKFCVKACLSNKSHCGTGRHSSKFEVDPDQAYIRVMENLVFMSLSLNLCSLLDSQRAKLMSIKQVPADWENNFKKVSEGLMVDWLEGDDEELSFAEDGEHPTSEGLLSPGSANFKTGIFDIAPTFSFESTASGDAGNESEEEILGPDWRTQKVEKRLEGLKSKLARLFLDIETSYTVLVTDLSNLHARVKQLATQVGVSKSNSKESQTTIYGNLQQFWLWGSFLDEARAKLENHFNYISSGQENLQAQVDGFTEEMSELQGVTSHLETWSINVNQSIEMFNK